MSVASSNCYDYNFKVEQHLVTSKLKESKKDIKIVHPPCPFI
jgi:hypothetical protein